MREPVGPHFYCTKFQNMGKKIFVNFYYPKTGPVSEPRILGESHLMDVE